MKMGIRQTISIGLAAVMLLPAGLIGQTRLSVPMDAAAGKKLIENARAAQQEGNHAVALREYGRALEVYPNEPLVRAPIYLAMSEEAKASGDAAQAKVYQQMGEALDPDAGKRAQGGAQATTTRGNAETASAVGQGALTMLAAILQARDAAKAAKLQKAQLLQQQQMAQQAQVQMQMQTSAQPAAPPPGYAYPPAPVGQPGYPPPTQAYQPMPGYAPAPGQVDPNAAMAAAYAPPVQMQAQPGYPPPAQMQQQPGYPPPAQPQYAQQQQPGYPPPAQMQQQPGYPSPAQPQYAQQQQPGYPPPAQMQQQPGYPPPAQPQYAQQQQPGYPPQPQYAAAPPSPYGAPQGYAMAMATTRGDTMKPIRVVHDHALLGDAAYFANGCGALVAVANGSLTFTPTGGEAPLVIPAAEIADVRLNTVIGREIGAFHITTRKGLYLNLAMESGKREDTRATVDELRKQLGLGE